MQFEILMLPMLLLLIALLIVGIWLRHTHNFWDRHNIPCVRPLLFMGNLKDLLLMRTSFGDLFHDLHHSSPNSPVVGIYLLHTPALIVRHPDLIKNVLIKNFDMFLNRYEAADQKNDSMGSLTLPLSKFHIWRPTRIKIAEFFTSGRLKSVFYPKMLEVAKDLELAIENKFLENSVNCQIFEVKELAALFTTDLTAALSYGIKSQGLLHGDSKVLHQARQLLKPTFKKALQFFCLFFLPHQATKLSIKTFTKEYEDFFRHMVKDKQKAVKGDTLIDLLLELQSQSKHRNNVEFIQHEDFVASQAAIFLLAGFETSSSVIAFTLYELAKQPLVQQRLREEIKYSLCAASKAYLSYEQLQDLPYLQQCVAEGLRLYPAAAFINRECTAPHGKGFSLLPFADFHVPTGMPLYISILGIQRDAAFWPNPEYFDPDRFEAKNIPQIHPMTYIPFGDGPHGCVGKRLGLLQVKLGLLHILKHYQIETCCQTADKIQFDPGTFMLEPRNGIYLKFVQDSLI